MDFAHNLTNLLFAYVFPKMCLTAHWSVGMLSNIKRWRYSGEECLGNAGNSWFLS